MRFTSNEADLYYCLLNECNLRGWENPFECRNGVICSTIGVSEKTLIDIRRRLQDKGLINYQAGQRKKQSPIYTIVACGMSTSRMKGVEAKSKNPKNEKSLTFPFSSDLFREKWMQLLATPKWKKKPTSVLQLALNKLKDFDEAFVLDLIDQAIIGGWQGLVFADTQAKYEAWQRLRNKTNITNHNNGKAYEQF